MALFPDTIRGQNSRIPELKSGIDSVAADTRRVDMLSELASELILGGQVREARRYLEKGRRLADSLDYESGREQVMLGFGDLYLTRNRPDSAAAILEKAVERYPDSGRLISFYNLLATAYRYQGDNYRAIDTYEKTLGLIDTTDASQARKAAAVNQNMAAAYMNLGNSAETFERYSKAITYAEAANDSVFLATALNNIGNAYVEEGQFGEAVYYLERAIDVGETIGLKPEILRATLNLGNARNEQSRFAEAESLYNKALQLTEEVRPGNPPIRILYNLGRMYRRKADLENSERHFRRSLDLSRKQQILQGIYYNSTGLGNLAEERGNLSGALEWYGQALEVAEQLDTPPFIGNAHQRLYELNKKQENYAEALPHLERYKALTDSLKSREKERMLAEYQTRLEVQRQEQRNRTLAAERDRQQARLDLQYWLILIGVLMLILVAAVAVLLYRANRDKKEINRQLQQQKVELERLNDVKNKLFAIVTHDLRTPLSGLVSMLEMFRMDALTDDELKELAGHLEVNLQQNVNIIENLLAWAKNQMESISIDREKVNARELTGEMLGMHEFNARHKNIKLNNRVSSDVELKADPNLFKLILRNLISNAIKFSEPGDEVTIGAGRQREEVVIEVRDTGIGIPGEIRDKIFLAPERGRSGTHDEKGSGIGLSLCKEFAEKMGGSLWFDSEEGKGTSFYLSLPSA
ncbi:MAG: tetratricopeptide repeat-containing sensor histidine kinase [Balneolaceae bacterium]|nr:tetratricopeptide repeat-containing sensor histidine kinase [Balneolaceae bacterium]